MEAMKQWAMGNEQRAKSKEQLNIKTNSEVNFSN